VETLKEVLIDVVLFLGAWFIVTASGLHKTAEGMSCGRAEVVSKAKP
jgi:hypothetical protein